jgi:cell division protein FtsQ
MPREMKKSGRGIRWRLWLTLAAVAAAIVSTALGARKVRQFALEDPQFTLTRESFRIEGVRYVSRAKVQRVFASDFGRSVFRTPLAERRRRLLAIDWVESASVSRIWPSRLLIRIRERKPVAFVLFRSGVLLIDAQGVLLDPPPQAQFTFPVLGGVREGEPEERLRERVGCLLRVLDELGGNAKDVSEVNCGNIDNVRLVMAMDQRAVELVLGDSHFAARYHNFATHYPEIQKRSPGARIFDLRLADRIAVED